MPERSADRRGSAASRGYDATWRRLRDWHLSQYPLCEYCTRLGKLTPADVVDHIKPFDGPLDPLRLQTSNLQSLCKSCHDGAKQQLDKTGRLRGADTTGAPLDPNHHWARTG